MARARTCASSSALCVDSVPTSSSHLHCRQDSGPKHGGQDAHTWREAGQCATAGGRGRPLPLPAARLAPHSRALKQIQRLLVAVAEAVGLALLQETGGHASL